LTRRRTTTNIKRTCWKMAV